LHLTLYDESIIHATRPIVGLEELWESSNW